MTEPNSDRPIPAEAVGAVAPPATTAQATDVPRQAVAGSGREGAEEAAESPAAPSRTAPPRPFWRAFGNAIVHLLAMGALLFVLVGLAPRVERICERMQYDDCSSLTVFVFDAGYFVRKNWFLAPLLLLFDLGVLWILRRSLDPALARNYTTFVVAVSLLLSIVFGFGLIAPLGELMKGL